MDEIATQKRCLLLDLPAELRNIIYSYVLIQPIGLSEASLPSHLFPGARPATSRRRLCANILKTCKQINEEASPILYGENIFLAHDALLATLPSLLLTTRPNRVALRPVLNPRPISMIRRFFIHVRLDTDPRFDRRKVQQSFSNVEELEVQVFQAMYGGSDFSVLELFEDVRGVKRAKIWGSIGDGIYASWLETSMMSAEGEDVMPFCVAQRIRWDSWVQGNR